MAINRSPIGRSRSLGVIVIVPWFLACNVESTAAPSGGIQLGKPAKSGCERGVVVLMTDRKSTNVGIAQLDGTPLSESFVSSGSAKPGLALALSGDVDVPLLAPRSGQLVLLDRFGSNVVTWMALENAEVRGQLAIGTGFESNPRDYVEVDEQRAYLARYGANPTPGLQPFDEGSDVLIVDFREPEIMGRIPIAEEDPSLLSRPSHMNRLENGTVVVTLGRWSSDYSLVGEGRFIGISPTTDTVVWSVELPGLFDCGRLVLAPARQVAAIACSSKYDRANKKFVPASSDIVLFDVTETPPREIRRLDVARRLDAGIQPAISFASDSVIVGLTYGGNATIGDTVFAVDTSTGELTSLAESTQRFAYGSVHCAPGCGDICLVTDAEIGRLRRWRLADGSGFEELSSMTVDTTIGLSPSAIGGL